MYRVRDFNEIQQKVSREFEKKFETEIYDLDNNQIDISDLKGKYVIVSHTDFATFFSVPLLDSKIRSILAI